MSKNVKNTGQVFTPPYLVRLILDEAGYRGKEILGRHCMENSCGEGAFLIEIVARYIEAYRSAYNTVQGVETHLEKYIHGIELDKKLCDNCIKRLNKVCKGIGLRRINFDVVNADALSETKYDGKMDFVIGNPPYVRVHNLEDSYDAVKSFSFAKGGMTDLYLVFFEKGFRMLKDKGRLCYITPSSWLNSVAGNVMRDYVRKNHNLSSLIDLEHFQPFNATTYTLIALFEKGGRKDCFTYNVFNKDMFGKNYIENLSFDEIDINGNFYISNHATLAKLKTILSSSLPKYVTAKNGFATLADKIFIASEFSFSHFVISTIKASTGKWYKSFFPYNKNGKPYSKDEIFAYPQIAEYLNSHKASLLKGSSEELNPTWFLYGRTQALKDVAVNKLAINTTIKDAKSLKLNIVPAGSGIYSGLYIISDFDFDIIKNILKSQEFVDYISSLKKYKSGGYYTFNSKDLEAYLNFTLNILIENGTLPLLTTQ